MLDRIVSAREERVIQAYEKRIAKLEQERALLEEKVAKPTKKRASFEECMELSLQFLARYWKIYKNGSHGVRQTVLRLAFSRPLKYSRNEGYRTIDISFPFKALEAITDPETTQFGKMVPPEGIKVLYLDAPSCTAPPVKQGETALSLFQPIPSCPMIPHI